MEFGGGYGSFCRLLYRLGYNGDYNIFDLPIFSCLQKYFLSHLGMNIFIKYTDTHSEYYDNQERRVLLINDIDFLKRNSGIIFKNLDLFIGLWSISEAPLDLRDYFLYNLVDPKYFLIAYQAQFVEIDNRKYFQELIERKNNYSWYNERIAHMADQYYLIGTRKEI